MMTLLEGLLLGFAYVMPIGAQNLFVIHTSMTNETAESFKISSFVIIAVIMISYSTCRRDQCWNSTYDDRKNEDSLSKFNSSCGRRNGQRYINGYSIILQGCAVNENVNCCCTGVENSDCKPGSSLNNGKCEICKQGSYNINYSESECMNLPKEFENNKIDNIIPT